MRKHPWEACSFRPPACTFCPACRSPASLQCPGKGWMVRPLYSMPPNLYRAQRWKFGRQGPGG